jgi:hypothetical protein
VCPIVNSVTRRTILFQSLKVKGIANAIKKTKHDRTRECLKRVLTNLKVNPKPDMITILGCYRVCKLTINFENE